MAMYPQSDQSGYSPSREQLERERALQRYNRLFIYVPVGIAALIATFLFGLMLVGIFAPGLVGAEEFLSGLADTILVLWLIPMLLLCSIVPLAYFAYLVNRRQRRNMLPPDSPQLQHSRVQMVMWQAQDIVDRAEQSTERLSDRIGQPFISLGTIAAYVFSWLTILTRPLRRENHYDPDGANDPDGPSGGN